MDEQQQHQRSGAAAAGEGSNSRGIAGAVEVPVVARPLEGLHSAGPPPFLTKTYDMVEDPLTDTVVSWSSTNNSFIVWNCYHLSTELLPKYFKHNNFSSFVRQLNTYGFRKVDPDRWEFANEGFLRGHRDLLKYIQRRKPPSQTLQQHLHQQGSGPCLEVGQFGGIGGEMERLRRDKNVLMMEVVKLRQHQQTTRSQLHMMGQRLHATEQKQQHMMTFLARAIQNPTFLAQLAQNKQAGRSLAGNKKRRRLPRAAAMDESELQSSSSSEGLHLPSSADVEGSGTSAVLESLQGFSQQDLYGFDRGPAAASSATSISTSVAALGVASVSDCSSSNLVKTEQGEDPGLKSLDETLWDVLFNEQFEEDSESDDDDFDDHSRCDRGVEASSSHGHGDYLWERSNDPNINMLAEQMNQAAFYQTNPKKEQ